MDAAQVVPRAEGDAVAGLVPAARAAEDDVTILVSTARLQGVQIERPNLTLQLAGGEVARAGDPRLHVLGRGHAAEQPDLGPAERAALEDPALARPGSRVREAPPPGPGAGAERRGRRCAGGSASWAPAGTGRGVTGGTVANKRRKSTGRRP